MTNTNIMFCRSLLRLIREEVKKHNPAINMREAWVWSGDRRTWEFHGPDDFYWYGRADNAYHARYQGWNAWLNRNQE